MKKTITAFLFGALLSDTQAQSDSWRQIFSVDPMLTNGAFILDSKQVSNRGIVRADITLVGVRLNAPGQVVQRTIGQVTITNGKFGFVSGPTISSILPGESVYYHAIGTNAQGNTVVDINSIPVGGGAWPEACRLTCHSPGYAWGLRGYSNGAQTAIEINNGVDDSGSYYYFYVPAEQWAQFKTNNPNPLSFGLSQQWSGYELDQNNLFSPQVDVVYHQTIPVGALALNGYAVGANFTGGAWAIRKDKGPWRNLYAWTNNYAQPSQVCDNLLAIYNADPVVVANRTSSNPHIPLLSCMALPAGGGGLSTGGLGPFNPCTQVPVSDYDGDIFAWALNAIECFTTSGWSSSSGFQDLHSISVTRWTNTGRSLVLHAVLPSEKDPKVTPVRKTALSAGLYEIMLVMDNGTVVRRYEEVLGQLVIHADFASFVNVNIYPVPVVGNRFAIDFDLTFPMSMNLSIINNSGVIYHAEALSFEFAGKNKHVVSMTSSWPKGLYHAVLQYPGGSSESVSFSVK